jgi:Uma2 family endonuclease
MMDAELVLDARALTQRWLELCNDPLSPDHFELNQFGEIILSPRPTTRHQLMASAACYQLRSQLGPEAAVEVSVVTDQGIRVPDAVWMPPARWEESRLATPLPFVPDVCVEILSPGNTREEIAMKKGAFLRGGAREVIVVDGKGQVEYFGPEAKREKSLLSLVLSFPQ